MAKSVVIIVKVETWYELRSGIFERSWDGQKWGKNVTPKKFDTWEDAEKEANNHGWKIKNV